MVLACLSAAGAVAAPIIVGDPGTPLSVSILSDGTNVLGVDVRANGIFGIFNPGFVGFALITDNGNAAPNAALLAVNFPGISETIGLLFDTANPVFSATKVTLGVLGAPISPAITDPVLTALLGTYTLDFNLVQSTFDPQSSTFLNIYTLAADVPEPAFGLMTGLSVLGMGAFFWRQRKRVG